jgi:hypothetical protein
MVALGQMNTVVKFEKNTPQSIAGGPGKIDSFAELLTTRGKLVKNSGSRFLDAGEITESNSYSLWVWYQLALYNEISLGAKMLRIVLTDGRKFTIATWEKVDEVNMWIKMTLNEKR